MEKEILQLRAQGRTYKQIVEQLGCSKATVSYYCDPNGKTKTRNRTNKRRKDHPELQPIERFLYNKPTKKDIREKVRSFQRRTGSKLRPIDKQGPLFTYHRMLAEYGNDPRCYLTGRPVDLMNNSTYSLDHIVPASRGGTNEFDNMGITCQEANWAKSDMTVQEFVKLCCEVAVNFGCTITGEPKIPEKYGRVTECLSCRPAKTRPC